MGPKEALEQAAIIRVQTSHNFASVMDHRVLRALLDRDRFAITTHVRPDGDAVGSQLALGLFLRNLGKDVALINKDPVPDNFAWMPGAELIEEYSGSVEHLERFAEAQAIVVVDCNVSDRMGKEVAGAVLDSRACKILIDHHTDPDAWFDLVYRREDAAATGELVFELIRNHDPNCVTREIAVALYVALMTDTGSFRFDSVTPAIHLMAADLLRMGAISPATVYGAVYETRERHWARLLGRALGTLSLAQGGRLGYMYVSRSMFAQLGADSTDTEGFVEYPLAIEGVEVALLFTETASGTKISFRSKGDRFVHHWAKVYGGGGHRNAAGAYVRLPLDETIQDVLASADRFLGSDEPAHGRGLDGDDLAYLSSLLEVTR